MSARRCRLAGSCLAAAAIWSCSASGPGPMGGTGGDAGHSHEPVGGGGGDATGGSSVAGGMGGEDSGSGGNAGDVCGTVSGEPGSGTTPRGRLDGCYGPCPNGQCDSSDSFFVPGCADLYPCSVDSSFPFCSSDGTFAYCLMTGETPNQAYWLIACDEGTASFEFCQRGCSAPDGETYSCL